VFVVEQWTALVMTVYSLPNILPFHTGIFGNNS